MYTAYIKILTMWSVYGIIILSTAWSVFVKEAIMKREEKNILSKRRILDAAMEEFSQKGYDSASLNTVCAEKGISKGIIYHYFKDKDELYLLCVKECFDKATQYLKDTENTDGSSEEKLKKYFDARLRFFADNPLCLGIFADAALNPPSHLSEKIAQCRKGFDELNISVLTRLLSNKPLRKGLSADTIAEDFRMYMDFFNMRFKLAFNSAQSKEDLIKEHEERCRRQIDIMLHGVFGCENEK